MLLILTFTATLIILRVVASVVARPHDDFLFTLAGGAIDPLGLCNSTCEHLKALNRGCKDKPDECYCNARYFQVEGECLSCTFPTPVAMATVRLAQDAEITQCHDEGISVAFQLQLQPHAQSLVDEVYHQSVRLRQNQTVFLTLQIAGGHVGLVIVLAFAIFSRNTHRDPTFFNFCITWIFYSTIYSIALYRGIEGNTIERPLRHIPSSVCVVQAGLINGAQVMTCCSTMAVVIQLWFTLRMTLYGLNAHWVRWKQCTTLLLVVLPYVLFLTFAIPSVFLARTQTIFEGGTLTRAQPVTFYCSIIDDNSFDSLRATYGMTLGLLLITAGFKVITIFILYRHWRAFRYAHMTSPVSLSILIRISIFSFYRVVVAMTYGLVLYKPPEMEKTAVHFRAGDFLSFHFAGVPVFVDMLQAALPLVGFFVLGVNADLLRSVVFWQKNEIEREKLSTVSGSEVLNMMSNRSREQNVPQIG